MSMSTFLTVPLGMASPTVQDNSRSGCFKAASGIHNIGHWRERGTRAPLHTACAPRMPEYSDNAWQKSYICDCKSQLGMFGNGIYWGRLRSLHFSKELFLQEIIGVLRSIFLLIKHRLAHQRHYSDTPSRRHRGGTSTVRDPPLKITKDAADDKQDTSLKQILETEVGVSSPPCGFLKKTEECSG